MARPISVPPAFQRPIGSSVEKARTYPYLQPSRLQTPSISQAPLELTPRQGDKDSNNEEQFFGLGSPSCHETEFVVADNDDIDYDPPSRIITPYIPSAISVARSTPSRPVVETDGVNPLQSHRFDDNERTMSSAKPTTQISRSTQTAYQNVQSQAGDGDVLKSATSDNFSFRVLGVVDVWEKLRQELWKTVDSTKLDDTALGTLISNYQDTLEKTLGRLAS